MDLMVEVNMRLCVKFFKGSAARLRSSSNSFWCSSQLFSGVQCTTQRERKKRETKESNQRKIRDKKEREITQNNFVVYRFKIIEKKIIYIDFYFSFVLSSFVLFFFSSLLLTFLEERLKLNTKCENFIVEYEVRNMFPKSDLHKLAR